MLDLTQPVQTRDGRPVRLLATDAKVSGWKGATDTLVGLVTTEEERDVFYSWQSDGTFMFPGGDDDLINVPEPATETYHVLRDYPGHARLDDALEYADHFGSLGVVKVTTRNGRVEDVDLAYARS